MRRRNQQFGFTMLEIIVAIAVMAIGFVLLNTLIANSADRDRETLAAQHMRRVVDAAERYINDNNAALIASATPTVPAVLTLNTLRTASYLPNTFSDLNAFGQSYEIRVLEPAAGQLSTLILTNAGEVIPEGGLRRVSRQVGPEGGYVSTGSPSAATGAYSGWTMNLATYGAANGGGRVAAGLFFRDGQQVSDYLYRSAVAGHPELNAMNAPIDMGNNNVTNAGNVTANSAVQGASVRALGRLYAGEYIEVAGVVAIGTTCSPNGMLGRQTTGRLASCVSGVWVLL